MWNVSLYVDPGEIVAVIGANGAGKTTLLNTLSGINRNQSGQITFDGKEIENAPTHEIVNIGLVQVPEGRRLFRRMTVLENLKLGAYSMSSKKFAAESLKNVFAIFPDVALFKGRSAHTLSGGEAQMVAIARGLMSKPKLLLLDEISQGLAPKIVSRIFGALQQIRKQGMSVVVVEQNVRLALSVADRAYVLENGSISLSGKASELKESKLVKEAYLGI